MGSDDSKSGSADPKPGSDDPKIECKSPNKNGYMILNQHLIIPNWNILHSYIESDDPKTEQYRCQLGIILCYNGMFEINSWNKLIPKWNHLIPHRDNI